LLEVAAVVWVQDLHICQVVLVLVALDILQL
jgi:hypothetical protein